MTSPVHPDDLFRLRFITGADLSPDGNLVAYSLTRADIGAGVEHVDLYLVETASGTTKRLTSTDAVHGAPAFSPDGQRLAFMSTRSGLPQIWVMALSGGEATQLTSLARGIGGGPVWSPDGRLVAFTAGPQGPPRDPSAPYRVDRTVWRSDGMGLVADVLQDIYVTGAAGAESPAEAERLTDDDWMNTAPQWCPDGRQLVYVASHDPDYCDMASLLRQVDLEGEVKDLTGRDGMVLSHSVSSDGRVAYALAFPGELRPGSGFPLVVVDPTTGASRRITAGDPEHMFGFIQMDTPSGAVAGGIAFATDERRAYVAVQNGGRVNVRAVDLDAGELAETVASGDRVVRPIAQSSGKLLSIGFDVCSPGDLYLHDIDSGAETRLTDVNAEVLSSLEKPVSRRLQFRSEDGAEIEGWFLSPPDTEGPLPTVMIVHGGPHAAWGYAFYFDALMFVGAGFGVILVNQRGSTGYGADFATAITGDWGHLDAADLMAGIDHAVVEGLADPDRLGICGVSGGGNLTGWAIGHTDRFKAAVPENPLFDWVSMYGTSDIGAYMGRGSLGTDPHLDPELYRRCSPLSYAHRVTTPTLLLQHENDYRCPAGQSEQFYTALRVAGVPAEMLRFPGTGHNGSANGPLSHRRAQNEAQLEWMQQYLLV